MVEASTNTNAQRKVPLWVILESFPLTRPFGHPLLKGEGLGGEGEIVTTPTGLVFERLNQFRDQKSRWIIDPPGSGRSTTDADFKGTYCASCWLLLGEVGCFWLG
jgi:hypothetical protein